MITLGKVALARRGSTPLRRRAPLFTQTGSELPLSFMYRNPVGVI